MVSAKFIGGVAAAVILVAGFVTLTQIQHPSAPPSSGSESTTSQQSGFVKGLAFSPAAYNSTGMNDFFLKAKQAGGIVEWAGDWQELASGGGAGVVAQLASQHGLESMVVVQFFTQSTGQLLRPLNSTNEQNYLDITAAFVRQYRPAYLGLGIEVNVLYEKNPESFRSFVTFYSQVYDEVKSLSPSTQVFTVFQLEKMNGLNGGLYGGVNDPGSAEWQLLSQFPKDDVLGFTTYPGLVYHNSSEIPQDYYSRIASHSGKPVGFTEVGWQSGSVAGGWNNSEARQAGFVARFFALTRGLDKAFVVWSFLYDQRAIVPFNTMGLFSVNGTVKQAWSAWLSGT